MGTVYDTIGVGYASGRRTDPRWTAPILAALGDASRIVNVGAGTGSYEPPGTVLAVEPSSEMIRQRRGDAGPVVQAVAERLPVRDGIADAALAILTVHHWTDWRRGIAELCRVARRQVVLAFDMAVQRDFWLVRDYLPEVFELDSVRAGAVEIADELGADSVIPLPLPWDFTDGVLPAHWRRPEAYFDPLVRQAASGLQQIDQGAVTRGLARLREDLDAGRWAARNQELLAAAEYDAGFRLVVRN
jgi:SAM-dependent methyltransferase